MAKTKTPRTGSSTDRATAYALDVTAGKIVAGPHIRNACRRHLDDLEFGAERGLVWDVEAAQRVWDYFEQVLKLSEGQFEGLPFLLHPSQAFKAGSLFGWKRTDGARRFRRAYIEEGKGNGKSPFAGGVGLYGLTADGEAGAQIYAAAAKKEQAAILFLDAVKMVRRSPALSRRLKMSGGLGREFNIANHSAGSFFRPISKDAGKTGSGPRPHFALCDEVHEHPDRSIMEMLERGFKFRQQPLLLMITNSGSDRHSVCWEEHEHAVRVAAGTRTPDDSFSYVGEVLDDTTFSFVCGLDKDDDPLEDPSCWVKANPLLGTILTQEYLAGVVSQAKAMPGKRNGILRLHFCEWTDADEAWIGRETLESVLEDFDPEEHLGAPVYLGADLSGSKDLTAVAHVVQTGTKTVTRDDGSTAEMPTFDAWIEAWTPGDTVEARAAADAAPYDVWVKQGWLKAPEGQRIRLDHVAAYLQGVDRDYDVQALAYDRYAYAKLSDELNDLGCELPEIEHPQGGKRKARPPEDVVKAAKLSGEPVPEGLWMPGSVNALEALILEGRIRLKRNPVLISACMSAAVEADPFDNRWFSKRKATQRIDPLVALAMAVGAATAGQVPDSGPEVYFL
jgi:phage terminase large subunit-like protein